jgi:hypothetical protein
VRCGTKNFVYLYNASATEENIRLTGLKPNKKKGKLTLFNTETGRYSSAKFEIMPDQSLKIDQLKLQPKGDMILIW